MGITSLQNFIDKNKRFVKLEKFAEEEQNKLLIESHSLNELCNAGLALKKLKILNTSTNYDGRLCIKFGLNLDQCATSSKRPFFCSKSHKFSNGDNVNVCLNKDHANPIAYGLVSKVSDQTINVSVDDFDKDELQSDNKTFCLIKAANSVTYERLMKTLDDLSHYEMCPGSNLVEILFGVSKIPGMGNSSLEKNSVHFENNPTANEIVNFCLNDRRPISVVHGPPGTGKTTTLSKIIQILAPGGRKILACAASNTAVDNLAEKILSSSVKIVRLGHPVRTQSDLRIHTLDYMLKNSDQREFIDEIRKEMSDLRKNRRRFSSQEFKREKKRLAEDLRSRENKAMSQIASNCQVVCCTLTNAAGVNFEANGRRSSIIGDFLGKFLPFDCVVVDECAQATELACWAALLLGKRCILAGDHNQLTPTIISEKAASEGFGQAIMQRIVDEFPRDVVNGEIFRLLKIQYRMNKHIMQWSSSEFYENQLLADDLVADHLLHHLNNIEKNDETDQALLLIDTSDCDMNDLTLATDQSKANIGEVKLIYLHVQHLIRSGLNAQDIAVITPYNLQVNILRYVLDERFPGISIRSVDGFQGQEKEAVILSLVRSNKKGDLGFLTDYKRINVAATRARRHLTLICDVSCVSRNNKFIKSLTDHIQNFGLTKSALEYQNDIDNLEWNIDLSELDIEKEEIKIFNRKDQNSTERQHATKFALKNKLVQNPVSKPAFSQKLVDENDQKSENLVEKFSDKSESFRSEILEKMTNFVESDNIKFEFDTDLNAAQRRIVHEIAESMLLDHYSIGEDNQRKIIIEKPCPRIEALSLDSSCSLKLDVKKPKPPKISKPKIPLEETLQSNVDDLEFLDSIIQQSKFCRFNQCQTNIDQDFLGLICKFCKFKFCFKHHQAEIHGCGIEAKREAKRTINGLSDNLKLDKRSILEQKLSEKIDKTRDKRLNSKI